MKLRLLLSSALLAGLSLSSTPVHWVLCLPLLPAPAPQYAPCVHQVQPVQGAYILEVDA